MREFKFRAWNTFERKWEFGYEYPNLGGFSLTGEIVLMGELNSVSLDTLLHCVIFMQYTGLKDINGKEIYEDDVLEINNKKGVVIFESGCYFLLYDKVSPMDYLFDLKNINKTIIGNIHENPEILKIHAS